MTQHIWVVEVKDFETGKWYPAYDGTGTWLKKQTAIDDMKSLRAGTDVKYRVKKYIRQD